MAKAIVFNNSFIRKEKINLLENLFNFFTSDANAQCSACIRTTEQMGESQRLKSMLEFCTWQLYP